WNLNAILVAGACGVYLSGGLGPWELVYPAVGGALGYLGLRSYRAVGVGWLLHAAWDLVHHLFGDPIWPFMPTSSFGCLVFDSLIAIWFLAGAPSGFALVARPTPSWPGELVGSQATHRRAPPSVNSSAGARARRGRQ
ncbi:MAG TPA: DUF6010 family protein, partial [Kofleriaceae bacterium]|nr:DUF6010 family protein [Kofleriaceae bacterium]